VNGGALTSTAPWLNTTDYTPFQLALFAAGCLGWVIAYIGVSLMLKRRKFVEIPAGAVVANIAWEFVWGFVYGSDMGRLFTWGYALWAVQDVYITAALFRYGHKQVSSPALKRAFRPAAAFGIVAWAVAIYYFVADGYDPSLRVISGDGVTSGYGAISGYILNVMMSALYIGLVLRHDPRDFSALVAWSKMIGTALLSVFNAMVRPHDSFLMALCAVTFLLDVAYIVAFYKRRARFEREAREGLR
jgi:hypothetical protein